MKIKPQIALETLRSIPENTKCRFCIAKNPTKYNAEHRLVCGTCPESKGQKLKSILFDPLTEKEFNLLKQIGNREVSEKEIKLFNEEANQKKTEESQNSHENADEGENHKKKKKFGSISIEELKNKKRLAKAKEEATQRENEKVQPVKKEEKPKAVVEIKPQEFKQEKNVKFVSLDRPKSKFKAVGTGDIGLVSVDTSADGKGAKNSKTDNSTFSYQNLQFVSDKSKSKTEILKEKGKHVVEGIVERLRRMGEK